MPLAFSPRRLPPDVPTYITLLLACAGVEAVKFSAAVYDHPRKPHVAFNACILFPDGTMMAPSDESDGDAAVGAPVSTRQRNAPAPPSHTPSRVSLPEDGAAATMPASGSTMGALVVDESSGTLHFTTPV